MVTSVSEPSPQRHRYGSDPSQFADLHLPARRRRPGTVALLHGGWWGPRFGAGNLDAVAADLAGRGWVAWNIEYRRLGLGGGYPATLQDAAAAIDHLATLADVDTKRVVAVGHSAGGHLAAWAAGRTKLPAGVPGAEPVIQIAGLISLAGVLDLGAAACEKIGNGAAIELMGGDPGELPQRYAVADPLSQVPIPAVVRCVHARADDRVPFAQSVTYVAAARAAGQDARLLEVDGGHFSVADTSAPTWPVVINALEELLDAAEPLQTTPCGDRLRPACSSASAVASPRYAATPPCCTAITAPNWPARRRPAGPVNASACLNPARSALAPRLRRVVRRPGSRRVPNTTRLPRPSPPCRCRWHDAVGHCSADARQWPLISSISSLDRTRTPPRER